MESEAEIPNANASHRMIEQTIFEHVSFVVQPLVFADAVNTDFIFNVHDNCFVCVSATEMYTHYSHVVCFDLLEMSHHEKMSTGYPINLTISHYQFCSLRTSYEYTHA